MENVVGIGTDIIEVDRIESVLATHEDRFLKRIFTEKEQEYCSQHKNISLHLAGRFAAKEAIVKAFGGFEQAISWTHFEILNDANGKPHVYLSPYLQTNFPHHKVLISISHCHKYATATALVIISHQ